MIGRLLHDASLGPYRFALVLSLICALLYLFGSGLANTSVNIDALLAYRYDAITQGELWRVFSGNLLHTNHWHLLMNLGGLWAVMFLHHFHYSFKGASALFIGLCILEGLGLWCFYPELKGYVGLSGVLHGLFAYGAVADIQKGMKSGYLLLIGVIAKVGYEQLFGASTDVTEMIGARVATEAHLVGLISGLFCIVAVSAVNHYRKSPEHSPAQSPAAVSDKPGIKSHSK